MEGETKCRQEAVRAIYKITSKLFFDDRCCDYAPRKTNNLFIHFHPNKYEILHNYLLNEWHQLFACNLFQTGSYVYKLGNRVVAAGPQ